MAYCCRCGVYAALDDDKTCTACRLGWRPSGPVPADLGCHKQPQPLGNGPKIWSPPSFPGAEGSCISTQTREKPGR